MVRTAETAGIGNQIMFYLGTCHPDWLTKVDFPLFVSRRAFRWKTLPRAKHRWALDSGGFTELSMFGAWQLTERDYANRVGELSDQVGNLEWAAPQDWMCEPFMLGKTGKSVIQHQELTVANFLELKSIAPELPWVPVLQGWEYSDYLRCVDMYASAGVDLAKESRIGLGTVCRRQHTGMVEYLISDLSAAGFQLHGFGFKLEGLRKVGKILKSADSMAWSFNARRDKLRLVGCKHQTCSNCLKFASDWRGRVLEVIECPEQARMLF